MKTLEDLYQRILSRVDLSLRAWDFSSATHLAGLPGLENMTRFYGFYGVSDHYPLHLDFRHSTLSGSYFLGPCDVSHSLLYKSDLRGDELKRGGGVLNEKGVAAPVLGDEHIRVRDSILLKTLVHNFSHDLESPEDFYIINTVALPYANIHGSPSRGCALGSLATVDLTTVHDCVIGDFSYVQTGELAHQLVEPGTIWVEAGDVFEFYYQYDQEDLAGYLTRTAGSEPSGLIVDFIEGCQDDFACVFESLRGVSDMDLPRGTTMSPYALVTGESVLESNVLVAQRAYIKDSYLGQGANAQENCFIIGSRLEGLDVTAHGGKIIGAHLQKKVFTGFNSFIRGRADKPLDVGEGSILMPHTIIDAKEPLAIPPRTLVWGCVRTPAELAHSSIPLEELAKVDGEITVGRMRFQGQGAAFVDAFRHRIEHILEANGAYFQDDTGQGHAQMSQNISYNTMQPYASGEHKGMFPTMSIRP